jgi:hypothetical protein
MKKNPQEAKHEIGTRKEWLAARLKLLKAEKEHTRRGDELALMRQELPWVRVDKSYRFETDEGKASLSHLFRGRSQLLFSASLQSGDFIFQDRRLQPLGHSSIFDSNVFCELAPNLQTLRHPLHRQFLALFRAVEKIKVD